MILEHCRLRTLFKLFAVFYGTCLTSFVSFLMYQSFLCPCNLLQFVSEEYHRGLLCLKYERKNKQYNKTNTYSLYISKHKPHKPLRYEMTGYDDMLASHYDHYVIDYVTFEAWMFNYTLFNLPEGKEFSTGTINCGISRPSRYFWVLYF